MDKMAPEVAVAPPAYEAERHRRRRGGRAATSTRSLIALIVTIALVAPFSLTAYTLIPSISARSSLRWREQKSPHVEARFKENVRRCKRLHMLPGVPDKHWTRTQSDRYVEDTPDVLVKNATLWTGDDNGNDVQYGADVLLSRGLVKKIGKGIKAPSAVVHEADGAWLTPGIFDMHSHIGVDSYPALSGASDTNSVQAPILPYLRSLDAINTHDLAYKLTIAGGVTTSLILPGSANNIGGQAFVVKLRNTTERTPDSMVLEMPYNVAEAGVEWPEDEPPRWRHAKHACGENIRRVYHQTRLDLAWNFRSAYDKARQIMEQQDDFCEDVLLASERGEVLDKSFPEDLQWEMLVDVLRGKVKVNTHCYESTDFAAFVRHTNEFKFPVAAFHHAHEAYIVPELLKQAYGNTPAVAIFATNARYKREAWRGSEYAARELANNNISVIMKSDHPVTPSRYLLWEAQQVHHFGLPENLALASITTTPAKTAGFDHRVGFVRENYDADLVLWDSHPLQLGATPQQVWIDGIAQLAAPVAAKEVTHGKAPEPAPLPRDYDPYAEQEDDQDPAVPSTADMHDHVDFVNVAEALVSVGGSVQELKASTNEPFTVQVRSGEITCVGVCEASKAATQVDLHGGSLLPPLYAYGPALGLVEIIAEKSTVDNAVFDPLADGELSALQQNWGPRIAVKAIDALEFGGKHLAGARKAGLTRAVTAPMGDGFFRGVSVAFRTGARHVLEKGAVIKEAAALHVTIGHYKLVQRPSISTQVAELRLRLLTGLRASADKASKSHGDEESSIDYWAQAATGDLPLVVNVWKADHMATLVRLKGEVESTASELGLHVSPNWIIHGGQESHVVARELAAANISVILSPPRAMPESWDERRAPSGAPLSNVSSVGALAAAGVKTALGVPEEWQVRTLLWEAAWAVRNSNGKLGRKDAVAMLSSNVEQMFGLTSKGKKAVFVAHERDPLEFGSRVAAIADTADGLVEILV